MADGRLRKADYYVCDVGLAVAQALVARHHYARGGANTGTYVHGLFRRGDPLYCLGVAWWIPPTKAAAIAAWDGDWRQVLSLSRLVIVPDVPHNAASFLIGQSVKRIAADGVWRCLVTYADEWQGHTGAIYRATNWEYRGRTTPEAAWVDPRTRRMVARKAGPHTRTRDEMLALGYECLGRYSKHRYRLVVAAPRRLTRQIEMWEAIA